MPDPLVAAAEAISNDVKFRIPAPGEPIAIVDPQLIFDLRAALAAHRQRDERAEAAIALCEAEAAVDAASLAGRKQTDPDYAMHAAAWFEARQALEGARRRWAEVEGRET